MSVFSGTTLLNDKPNFIPAAAALINDATSADAGYRESCSIPEGIILFFSFDVVGSTQFKAKHKENWFTTFKETFNWIRDVVRKRIKSARLWKGLGDELVYYIELTDPSTVPEYVGMIFETLQAICAEGAARKDGLLLKGAAWLAAVDNQDTKLPGMDFNISDLFTNDDCSTRIVEFYGPDIDTGFRIAKLTKEAQLVLSFELAQMLMSYSDYRDNVLIVTFEKLKGVWDGNPYPIIWYYDRQLFEGRDFMDSHSFAIMQNDDNFPEYFKALHFLSNTSLKKCMDEIEDRMHLGLKMKYYFSPEHYKKFKVFAP